MDDRLSSFWSYLKSLPMWLRSILLLLLAGLVLILSISCGPTVRVSARTTTDSVTISVSQNVVDSTGVSVSVSPNIHITPKSF